MGSNKGRKDTKKASEILDESLERMMPPLERTEDTILSGFKNLDEGTDGFRKGTITIIGGRPAQGKTTLAKCIIQDKSLNDAVPTAYFVTKDMSAALNGLILGEADVPPYKVKKGMVSAEEKTEIYNTASKFEDVPLFLDDRSIKTISRLKKRIEQLNEFVPRRRREGRKSRPK
jgi:replicative DNA helicase